MRRKKQVWISRGRVLGQGETKAEAKADLERGIDKALEGRYEVAYIHHPGCDVTLIVYRTPTGTEHAIVDPRERNGARCIVSMSDDFEEAVRGARMHVAQVAMKFGGVTGADVIENEEDRREHLRWVRWQYAMRELREEGYNLDLDDTRRLADERARSIVLPGEEAVRDAA